MLMAVVGPSGAGKDTLMAGARAALAEPFRGIFIIAAVLVGAAAVMAWRVPLRRY